MKILIVEDETVLRETMVDQLEKEGYDWVKDEVAA